MPPQAPPLEPSKEQQLAELLANAKLSASREPLPMSLIDDLHIDGADGHGANWSIPPRGQEAV